jgi:hypothetical protein
MHSSHESGSPQSDSESQLDKVKEGVNDLNINDEEEKEREESQD